MATEIDIAVKELAHLRVALRDDLRFSFQEFNGEACYVIEDSLSSRFFRVGVPEYRFICLLDGQRTLSDAIAHAARQLGGDAFTEQDAVTVIDWLLETELAVTDQPMRSERLIKSLDKTAQSKSVSRLNFMFQKFPLFNPDRLLRRLSPWLGFLVSPWFLPIWLAIVVSGLWQIGTQWDRFVAGNVGVFAAHNWLYLIIIWSLLKVVHECFHGLVCRRYGGEVLEAGIIMILFIPIGYVDATSSWRFPSKWMRIHTAAAGMYVEFFIAALAAWVWAVSEDPVIGQLAHHVVLIASINTLLFNANPLMKFDGYYMFSDWTEVPNLYAEGQQAVKNGCKRWLFGVESTHPGATRARRVFVGSYGVASLLWRITVVVTLLLVAHTLFLGAGLAVALLSGLIIVGMPLWNLLKYLGTNTGAERPGRLRFALCTLALAVLSIGLLRGFMVTPRVDIPAVIDYREMSEVRANTQGFIESVQVKPGDSVLAGQTLLVMRNRQLRHELKDIQLRHEQLDRRRQIALATGKIADAQSLREQLVSMQTNLDEYTALVAGLQIKAPHDGKVVARRLQTLLGQWIERGDTLLTVADTRHSELRISIEQDVIDAARDSVGTTLDVYIPGSGTARATLDRIHPKATREILHEGLTSMGGGPLAVQSADEGSPFELTDVRFVGIANIDHAIADNLRAGQRAWVYFDGHQQKLGQYLYHSMNRWVDSTIALAKASTLADPSASL